MGFAPKSSMYLRATPVCFLSACANTSSTTSLCMTGKHGSRGHAFRCVLSRQASVWHRIQAVLQQQLSVTETALS